MGFGPRGKEIEIFEKAGFKIGGHAMIGPEKVLPDLAGSEIAGPEELVFEPAPKGFSLGIKDFNLHVSVTYNCVSFLREKR